MKTNPFIVLAEDNYADIFLVRSALTEEGLDFQLHVVSDGEQALRFLETVESDAADCPDLFLLDLNLPRVSGDEVLTKLRQIEKCSPASVIVLTSSDSAQDRERAAARGVEHYFLKTANLDEFMALGKVVRELLVARESRG